MEKMSIDINLSGQEEGKFRTFFFILGTLGLIWVGLTIFFPEWGLGYHYFLWILFLPGFIDAILYGMGKRRLVAGHFPYLRINQERIEESKAGLFAKPTIVYWNDVKFVEIKLFEIHLTNTNGELKKIDLTNLTDDNLRIVKDFVLSIKKTRGL